MRPRTRLGAAGGQHPALRHSAKLTISATLGERLLLVRRLTGASGDTRGRYDVGPYENEAIEVRKVTGAALARFAELSTARTG